MTSKQAVYEAMMQASIERKRTEKTEDFIGGLIFTVLGCCVAYAIAVSLFKL